MARVVRKKGNVDWSELRQILKNLEGKRLQVGWFASAKYDDNTPVAGIAVVQEFGARGIPPRSFMRTAIAGNKNQWPKVIEKVLKGHLAEGATMEDAANALGLVVSGDIRKQITEITAPPLSPITLALRKRQIDNLPISGKVVGWVAEAIAKGETGPGQLGDSSGINPKPLVFTGFMLNSLTHVVDDK